MGMFYLIFFGFIGCLSTAVFVISYTEQKKKRERLTARYNDPVLVEKLMNKTFWVGMTQEQLVDSLGDPHDIDQNVLKTKIKEVWKYHHRGHNRYGLRITLEDYHVIGWDQKD